MCGPVLSFPVCNEERNNKIGHRFCCAGRREQGSLGRGIKNPRIYGRLYFLIISTRSREFFFRMPPIRARKREGGRWREIYRGLSCRIYLKKVHVRIIPPSARLFLNGRHSGAFTGYYFLLRRGKGEGAFAHCFTMESTRAQTERFFPQMHFENKLCVARIRAFPENTSRAFLRVIGNNTRV